MSEQRKEFKDFKEFLSKRKVRLGRLVPSPYELWLTKLRMEKEQASQNPSGG